MMEEPLSNDRTSAVSTSSKASMLSERLEVRLTLQDLHDLQTVFEPRYRGQIIKYSRNEFGNILSSLVPKASPEEYMDLFDRIDITQEGCVSWDMFAQFMLYEFMEKDEKVKTTQVPNWKELRTITTMHKDTIQRIECMKSTNKYLSVSKEGVLMFWDQHLRPHRHILISTESIKPRDLWVTDFVILQNVNKIAVAFTSKEIAFYDLSSKLDFNCQYKLHGLKGTPLCLDYWSNPDDSNEAFLVYGDVLGHVSALCFTSAQIALFERPPQTPDSKQQTNMTVNVSVRELSQENSKHNKNCRLVHHTGHKGWVRQVKYADHLECFISCSTGKEMTILLGFIEKASNRMRTTSFLYLHGVHSFDYHPQLNLIATGGVNHQVCLWNPYVISKPVGVLTGHMAAVIQVIFNINKGQLMTFSIDKVLRVWDIQQQFCLQRLAGIFPKGPEVQTVLYFDDIRNRLFVTFNYQLTMLEMKLEIRDRVMSHEKPVTAVVYNKQYNQVITACQGGTVSIWLIDTGQKIKQFPNCHGNAEITSMSLDQNSTRLLTGSTDGSVKLWDFNGHCHNMLMAGRDNPVDIAQVVVLNRSVLAIGWDRYITIFRNSAFAQYHVQPVDWKGGQEHQDDILTAAFCPPGLLATGSYDGEIIIWNTNTEHSYRKLQARSRQKLFKRPKTAASISSRPMTADSQASELELSFVVTKLVFLESRMYAGQPAPVGADLVSCSGGGWLRFWNIQSTQLVAEFIGHPHAASVIGITDADNKYLVSGDSDGWIKVWMIEDYLTEDVANTIFTPPQLNSSFQPHNDIINSLELCWRNCRLLVMSASSDASVALWDVDGRHIGEFGQDAHWKIEQVVIAKDEEEVEDYEGSIIDETKDVLLSGKEMSFESQTVEFHPESSDEFKFDPEYKANTWNDTVLGISYKEERISKRERKQPGVVTGFKQYTAESAVGPYGILDYKELTAMPTMKKPDFVLNPHKYFGEKNDGPAYTLSAVDKAQVNQTSALRAAFDEKTLFPRELLEYEAQTRNEQAKMRERVRDSFRKGKPVGILKPAVSSSNNLASESRSRLGSSVTERRNNRSSAVAR